MQIFRYLRRFPVLVAVPFLRDVPRMPGAAIAALFAICLIVCESAIVNIKTLAAESDIETAS
ncbi:hypothetical protein [Nostoc sp.]|uniref:hypothetical protein n=1 Tax=Nostoc sp. TaxID=1180 RepID=UPI002FFBEB4D